MKTQPIEIASFYKFTPLKDLLKIKTELKDLCKKNKILGTIILAEEGINGSIAGQASDLSQALDSIQANTSFQDLQLNHSISHHWLPFKKLKIQIKKEIVTFGIPLYDYTSGVNTGVSISPERWNKIIEDPEVLLLDTRNDFEVTMGTFKGSINPKTRKFTEFKEYVNNHLNSKKRQKIAMFCTGGIRCEKASSYLLEQGFTEVYQLEGGILNYLKNIPQDKSLWQGKCFVFDNRITEP